MFPVFMKMLKMSSLYIYLKKNIFGYKLYKDATYWSSAGRYTGPYQIPVFIFHMIYIF